LLCIPDKSLFTDEVAIFIYT